MASYQSKDWIFEKLPNATNNFRIKSKSTKEYFYAGGDNLKKDPQRRQVFTWRESNTPVNDPQNWGKKAEWEIIKMGNGFVIKNLQYSEYLLVAGSNFDYDVNRRSVFTWGDKDSLGNEGIWNFEKSFF